MGDMPLKVTVIFPMAGRGARFGCKFKPFLQICEETFIQAAVGPFLKWLPTIIGRLVFVCLEEQETEYSVSERLGEMFGGIEFELIRLEQPTKGPTETLALAVEHGRLSGRAIVCDCDHSIDVDPLFELLVKGEPADCVIPLWNLDGEDLKAWSVAAVSDDGRVVDVAEKRLPASDGKLFGVIGCYYFLDIASIARLSQIGSYSAISELVEELISANKVVRSVPIHAAEFFGDPMRLSKAVEARQARQH